ncbi:MAG: energy transducer TonB [Deltaproteobacteria bacterium]|nr:energy transducer TonB [Deltaproteobacteria bacterium]
MTEAPTEVAKAGIGPGTGEIGRPTGEKGGVASGQDNGVAGGTGTTPTAASKFLPPHMGAKQKLSGAEPDFPTSLRTPGAKYLLLAKICVDVAGAVGSVTLLKKAHPTLDKNVLETLKGWRFRPLMANGRPVPFCYPLPVEFQSE